MISVDLRRAIPHKAFVYLVALIPGVFFGVSVLFANPGLARQLIAKTQEALSPDRYLLLVVFLFLASVVGNALLVFASLIQFALRRGYASLVVPTRDFLRRELWLPVLRRLTHVRSGVPTWIQRQLMHSLRPYIDRLQIQVNRVLVGEPLAATVWLDVLTKQLLLKRCGLSGDKLPAASFDPLFAAFAKPTPRDLRGDLIMMATEATGWGGMVARTFAPALHARWYTTFAAFLIFAGLVHDFYVAKRLSDPEVAGILYLRDILSEFPKLEADGVTPPKPDDDPEEVT